jgi:hypothetical protein
MRHAVERLRVRCVCIRAGGKEAGERGVVEYWAVG